MNGGCHAVGPRPLAMRHERFGVILYCDPELNAGPTYMASYSQIWGTYISDLDGQEYPVQYAADCFLPDPLPAHMAWVRDIHQRSIDSRGAWNTHLERFVPEVWRERVFDPLRATVTRAIDKHWNPTHPIEWELANIG